jgi:hypothetical protein
MIEKIIRALILLCALAICVYLVIWVLGVIGLTIPAVIIPIIWVMALLVAILILWRAFGGSLGI